MERTVKQVASRVGLPVRTVRYYDRIGLVSPRVRSGAGYRLYSPEEEGKLGFIRQAKSLGLSLDNIRVLMAVAEQGCCGEVVPELDRLLSRRSPSLMRSLRPWPPSATGWWLSAPATTGPADAAAPSAN